jgi:hypothetical protein
VLERIQFGGMSISVEIGYRRVRIEVAKVLVGPVARLDGHLKGIGLDGVPTASCACRSLRTVTQISNKRREVVIVLMVPEGLTYFYLTVVARAWGTTSIDIAGQA